jgi:general secretion pathway protein H
MFTGLWRCFCKGRGEYVIGGLLAGKDVFGKRRKNQRQGVEIPQDKEMRVLKMRCSKLRLPGCHRGLAERLGFARAGFTMVEILIVIVIIAIAAMIAIPMASSADSLQVCSAANTVGADLEYAKSMAIKTGQIFSVVFDENTESYRIENQDGDVIEHPVKKGFDYVVDLRAGGRLDKVDIVSVNFDLSSEVKFDYLGSPYNGGGGGLNSGVVSLKAGDATATVSVEPVTGFILISD